MIPENVKKQIEGKYPLITNHHHVHCRIAAAYGYSLAQKEIERLKELIEKMYANTVGDELLWEQFKKENNI